MTIVTKLAINKGFYGIFTLHQTETGGRTGHGTRINELYYVEMFTLNSNTTGNDTCNGWDANSFLPLGPVTESTSFPSRLV